MILKVLGSALAATLFVSVPVALARESVLFYPTAAREGTNLLIRATWRPLIRAGVEHSKGVGGPLSADSHCWTVTSDEPNPGYWMTSVKIDASRTYLAGAWVRFSNAKILLRHFGHDTSTGQTHEWRIYLFSGYNTCLESYFGERTKELLRGNPDRWRPMFRTIRFGEGTGLANDIMEIWYGLYLAAGKVSFAEPFLVDITDGDRSYTVDIETQRPVSRLEILQADNRDSCWVKSFDKPTTNFYCRTSDTVDAFAEHEACDNGVKGHILVVKYADGGEDRVFSPENHIFTER